jgi:nucleotide-binding universal stress UspA family protein
MEEEAWRILYEVEDDAFELDVKLSLILEQGDPVERIIEIGTSYSGDLVVVPTSTQWPADLISRCPSPVVFVRSYKEE